MSKIIYQLFLLLYFKFPRDLSYPEDCKEYTWLNYKIKPCEPINQEKKIGSHVTQVSIAAIKHLR